VLFILRIITLPV